MHYLDVNPYLVNELSNSTVESLILGEGIILQPTKDDNVKVVEVLLNNESLINTTGVMSNGSNYVVAINNDSIKTITFNESELNASFSHGNNVYKIVIRDANVTSNFKFADNNTGKFLNFDILDSKNSTL